MRVLHVVEASFAGVGRHVLDLVEGLAELGVENHVFFGPGRASATFLDRLATSSAVAHPVPMSRAPSHRSVTAVAVAGRVISRHGVDLVHGHSTGGGAVARVAARRAGLPAVFTPNAFLTLQPDVGTVSGYAYRRIERALRSLTDALVCVSPEEARHAHAERYAPDCTVVVHNGIEAHGPPASPAPFRRGDPAEQVIGFVGRLDDQKRPHLAVSALAELFHGLGEQKVRLVVVGAGVHRSRLEDQVRRLGLEGQVDLLGECDGPAMMNHFDVLVVPSAYEGFPYVVLEGLRAGVPAVVSREVPIESFGPDPVGLTAVEATDPVALALALREALVSGGPPALVRATQAPFDIATMAAGTLEVYRQVGRS